MRADLAFTPPSQEQFWADGCWYAHSVDAGGRVQIMRVEPEDFDKSSFLDSRIVLGGPRGRFKLDWEDIARLAQSNVPVHGDYICHLSHVGSTLVSKLLGLGQGIASLREPVLLRWLAELRATAGEAEALVSRETYERNLRIVLALLGRPIPGRTSLLVKASSYANSSICDALAIQPQSRVLGLYVRSEPFAAAMMKQAGGRNDLHINAPVRLKRLHAMVGEKPWRLWEMSPGQKAGMTWLVEMATLQAMREEIGDRFRWQDFEVLLADCDAHLPQLAGHFGIAWGAAEEARLRESGLMSQYSKAGDGREFSARHRDTALARAREDHGEEIALAVRWIEQAVARFPALEPVLGG